MTFPFSQLDLRFGFVPANDFSSSGFYDPWPSPFQHANVEFIPPFDNDDVQVFLTPSSESLGPSDHHAAVVGVAHNVKKSAFELWARSTDCGAGFSSFSWLAINRGPLDEKRERERTPLEIRMARVQPLHSAEIPSYPLIFSSNCTSGDTAIWPAVLYSRPMEDASSPVVFVTQLTTDYDPTYFFSVLGQIAIPVAASVGMLRGTDNKQFRLAARNFDVVPGTPKYNYVALARSTDSTSVSKIADLRVTSGDFLFHLEAGGSLGDWGAVPIYFDSPFLAPPIVLMTAQSHSVQGPSDLRAFHGIANHVDQHGFTLNVRSADFEAGTMMMNWIAFGCGEACGG